MKEINFDKLCFESMKTGDLRNLAMIAIEMNEWYIPCEEADKEKIKPVIGCVRDESWIFAFTDLKRTEDFLNKMEIDAKIIKTTAKCAIYVSKEYEKSCLIKGIRFNEGISGWYLDSQNLESVMDEMENKKRKKREEININIISNNHVERLGVFNKSCGSPEYEKYKNIISGSMLKSDMNRYYQQCKELEMTVEETRKRVGCNAVNKGNDKDRTFRNY